jgi:hypothetical protein
MKQTKKQLEALEQSEIRKRYVGLRKSDNPNGHSTGRSQASRDMCTTREELLERKRHREKIQKSR